MFNVLVESSNSVTQTFCNVCFHESGFNFIHRFQISSHWFIKRAPSSCLKWMCIWIIGHLECFHSETVIRKSSNMLPSPHVFLMLMLFWCGSHPTQHTHGEVMCDTKIDSAFNRSSREWLQSLMSLCGLWCFTFDFFFPQLNFNHVWVNNKLWNLFTSPCKIVSIIQFQIPLYSNIWVILAESSPCSHKPHLNCFKIWLYKFQSSMDHYQSLTTPSLA